MIKACIFDIDGTLLDTLENLCMCMSETMETFGYQRITEKETRYFVGDGYRKFVERALLHSGDVALSHFEEACEVYRKIFNEKCKNRVRPYDGILKALDELKKNDIKIGVLSNKPHHGAVETMDLVFGKDYFSQVRGEQEGILRKPDPGMLLKMVEDFGLNKDEVMYFGDTNTDMQTGKSAGVITVGVTWGFRDLDELMQFSPEYIIHHPHEIVELVLNTK